MDDSNEGTTGPLGSSSIFGRIVAGHCDMDSIALSPSSSEFSSYIHLPIRETSKLINQETHETSATDFKNPHYERRNSRRESLCSPKRRNSNLTTSSFQSFDNLTQIMRENEYDIIGEFDDINHVTQSLPATPLTTPQASPPGSPKTERKNSKIDFNCSLPWSDLSVISKAEGAVTSLVFGFTQFPRAVLTELWVTLLVKMGKPSGRKNRQRKKFNYDTNRKKLWRKQNALPRIK
uniref:Uncharacterized protein n=1 Tax=Strigamia maritima TaxID=126957 RepID=T1IQJ6_STRMM